MSAPNSQPAITRFFLAGGLTQALFRWLSFRQFVAQGDCRLAEVAGDSTSLTPRAYLNRWASQHPPAMPALGLLRLAALAVVILGFGAMAGVLAVGRSQPINIWWPLVLFAFGPLLLTLTSLYLTLFSPARGHWAGHPLLSFWLKRLKLAAFAPYRELLLPWLFWQLQRFAMLFAVAALVAFFVLATFQDYRFGWSSTLITDDATMARLMALISWPWQSVVPAPSAELISLSRYSAEVPLATQVNPESWWQTMVMAVMVYGILPRVLLAFLLRERLRQRLKSNIELAGDIEQFMVAQQHQVSRNPLAVEPPTAELISVNLPAAGKELITWQQARSPLPAIKNLGSGDWAEDERWLTSEAAQSLLPLWLVVDPLQAPTGELADCISLLQSRPNQVALVLFPMPVSAEGENPRLAAQRKSWQFFAERVGVRLYEGQASAEVNHG
ncbi:DUF2868 domain-containing protein [Halioxenophilus sp. WMMB6]|uniref:DUF2868 domain-containing protein n=1 Tax=Halioxenophilus sp. WMMB6 TaxID=3073815 RepID=UPI00295F3946|nr:DUF2868 domain-containing protein [Halioxenophilus sp. WMMB6]